MTRPKKPERQEDCGAEKAIDLIGKIAVAAVALYSALEPIIMAIFTNEKKTK